jgi:hypothetical protein
MKGGIPMKHTSSSQAVQLSYAKRTLLIVLITWLTITVTVICLGVAARFFEAKTHVTHAVFLAICGILVQVFRHFAVKWLGEE